MLIDHKGRTLKKHKQYFNHKYNARIIQISVGEVAISEDNQEAISTVLGSCVSACIWDPVRKIGGMNHFMLPDNHSRDSQDDPMRYGVNAMEVLINGLLKRGAYRFDLRLKLFGGANLSQFSTSKIGTKNVEFIENYVKREGFRVEKSDLGGSRGRKLIFFPAKGDVYRSFTGKVTEQEVVQEEKSFAKRNESLKTDDEIELF